MALTTEISGQKDLLNSIEEMQTELGTVNLRMLSKLTWMQIHLSVRTPLFCKYRGVYY